jgi:hypothetical protein
MRKTLFTLSDTNFVDSFEGNTCSGDVRIDENTEVLLTFNGGKIDELCSAFRFIGRDNNNLKIYQICLETLKYYDPDCDILVALIHSYHNSKV